MNTHKLVSTKTISSSLFNFRTANVKPGLRCRQLTLLRDDNLIVIKKNNIIIIIININITIIIYFTCFPIGSGLVIVVLKYPSHSSLPYRPAQ